MNIADVLARSWHELARIASWPLGWTLPLVALFLFFLGLWALLNRFSERIEVKVHPETIEEEQQAATIARLRSVARERSADAQERSNFRRGSR